MVKTIVGACFFCCRRTGAAACSSENHDVEPGGRRNVSAAMQALFFGRGGAPKIFQASSSRASPGQRGYTLAEMQWFRRCSTSWKALPAKQVSTPFPKSPTLLVIFFWQHCSEPIDFDLFLLSADNRVFRSFKQLKKWHWCSLNASSKQGFCWSQNGLMLERSIKSLRGRLKAQFRPRSVLVPQAHFSRASVRDASG